MHPTIRNLCCVCRTATDVSKRCGRCKLRTYCSQECQRRDWDEGHRAVCKPQLSPSGEQRTLASVVNDSSELVSILSPLVYGVMDDGPYLYFPVLLCFNRPWEPTHDPTNLNPSMLCVIRKVKRSTFVHQVSQHMQDTGHQRLLATPHLIPRLMMRQVRVEHCPTLQRPPDNTDMEAKPCTFTLLDVYNNYLWTAEREIIKVAGSSVLETREFSAGDRTGDRKPETYEQMRERGKLYVRVLMSLNKIPEDQGIPLLLEGKVGLHVTMKTTRDGRCTSDGVSLGGVIPDLYSLSEPDAPYGRQVSFYA